MVTCVGTIIHVDIDPDWKVTFGKLQNNGYEPNGGRNGNGLALRIYRTKEHQLACFRDIESFRDISIPMNVVYAPKKFNKGQQTEETVFDKNAGTQNVGLQGMLIGRSGGNGIKNGIKVTQDAAW